MSGLSFKKRFSSPLPLLLIVLSCFAYTSVSNEDSATAEESRQFNGIPFSDLFKDFPQGVEIGQGDEDSSASGAQQNPRRKIVGVKKHKNYEIVLYEYSDEDLGQKGVESGDDFDSDVSRDGDEENVSKPQSNFGRNKVGNGLPNNPSRFSSTRKPLTDKGIPELASPKIPRPNQPTNQRSREPFPTISPKNSKNNKNDFNDDDDDENENEGNEDDEEDLVNSRDPSIFNRGRTPSTSTRPPIRIPPRRPVAPISKRPTTSTTTERFNKNSEDDYTQDGRKGFKDEYGNDGFDSDAYDDTPPSSTPFSFLRNQPRKRPNNQDVGRQGLPGGSDDEAAYDEDDNSDDFSPRRFPFRRPPSNEQTTSRSRPTTTATQRPRPPTSTQRTRPPTTQSRTLSPNRPLSRRPETDPPVRRPTPRPFSPNKNPTPRFFSSQSPPIYDPENFTPTPPRRRASPPPRRATPTSRPNTTSNSNKVRRQNIRRPSTTPNRDNYVNDDDDNYDEEGEAPAEEGGDEEEDPELGPFCRDPTGKRGVCQEYFQCSVLYSNMAGRIDLQDYKCRLPENQVGICCPVVDEKDTQGKKGRSLMKMVKEGEGRKVLSRQIKRLVQSNANNSISFGSNSIGELDDIEAGLLTNSVQLNRNSPSFSHNKFFRSSKRIRQVSNIGLQLLQTSNDLSDRLQLTNEDGGIGLKNFRSSNLRGLVNQCPSLPPCEINKYRTVDGSCNNLRKPKLGQSLTPLSRVLEPAYSDGRWSPRISVRGFNLPSPRLLSQTFFEDRDNPDNRYTLMVMQFGQFVDHDMSSVPIFTFSNNSGIPCCRNGQFLPPELRHPNCLPIEIPQSDPFYSRFNQRCMNFVRSRMAPRIDCSLGYADQMNAVTHWLDLSNVYGSNEAESRELRQFNSGLLRFSLLQDNKMLLPLKPGREIDYKAGDDRVNEMQGLMVMHLLWLREHNRIAQELAQINPFWTDEELYQETRRILIAQYQHIVYNEWLPIVVGREYMDSYGILPLTREYFRSYDPDVDASIENSFSSAGFRMGHTLVQGIVRLINEFGQDTETVVISRHAENAQSARAPNIVDKWIRGLAQQSIQQFDPFVSEHLNGRLFQARGGMFGMDLGALNVQRGRDHGIPGYNAFRELCQVGVKAQNFDDFSDWMAPEIIQNMRRTYAHPDDVDLWIGGLSEAPLPGTLVGPTFTCIIGDQFARLKKGDRYFYDLGDQTHSFSPDQLKEIRKSSFARILCDNGDNLEAIQPSSFLQPDFDFNSLVDCRRSSRIPRLNLRLWENEPTP